MEGYLYDTLVRDLVAWTENDNAEFLQAVDRIIYVASTKVARDIGVSVIDDTVEVYCRQGDEFLFKPPEYHAMSGMSVESFGGRRATVEPRTAEYCDEFSDSSKPGLPRYYAEMDEVRWKLSPPPDYGYRIRIRMSVQPQPMTPYRPRVWVGDHAPEALLYAALIGCEEFIKNDNRIETWRARYNGEIIPSLRLELSDQIRSRFEISPAMPAPAQE